MRSAGSKRWTHSPWLRLAIGVAAIVAGASLTFKPFSSLEALTAFIAAALALAGIGELIADEPEPPATASKWSRLVGAALIAAGVAVLVLPDATVRLVAIFVGIGAIVSGLARLAAAIRGTADERYVSGVGGLASVILGALALSWPDVTILAVALIVGPVAVIYGVGQILRVVFKRDGGTGTGTANRGFWGLLKGWGRFVGVTGALLIAAILVGISALLNRGEAEVDAFYDRPNELPAQAGQLLRQESFDRNMPAGSTARRVLYTTTRFDGTIATASALVIQPEGESAEPRPVLLWTHGTTGVVRRCAPSLLRDPLTIGGMPPAAEAIARGWVIVAPDYIGLGTDGPHPYLVGKPAAISAIDAVRAARQLDDLSLSDRTVVWGHSQGGGAALWVGIEAAGYAPDVPLAGVAALAPASDLTNLARGMLGNPTGMVFATYIVEAYSQIYPDVAFGDYVQSTGETVVRAMIDRCVELQTLVSVGETLVGESIFTQDLTAGTLGTRLAENIPSAPSGVPTFVGQGATDNLVLPDVQRAFVDGLCAAGQVVDYRSYAGRDHTGVVAADSAMIPDVLAWTEARFAGEAPPVECSFTER